MSQSDCVFVRDSKSWADIPTALLAAELRRRQDGGDAERPPCGSKSRGAYNTPIHVGALVLILVLSVGACAFPIIARRYPRFPVPHQFIFLSRHFGTGVLIATAFVHLFPTAYTSLTDPCLPFFWNKRYPPMAGLIAMVSVLIVVGIEMFFAMRGAGHVHSSDFDVFGADDGAGDYHDIHSHTNGSAGRRESRGATTKRQHTPSRIMLSDLPTSTETLMAGRSPSVGQPSPLPPSLTRKSSDSDRDDEDGDLDLDELTTTEDTLLSNGTSKTRRKISPSADESSSSSDLEPSAPSDHASHQKALLQCLLLEAGILFHSIFIGMALSVSTGPPFAVLLLAISFHQTFEGLALGSRIAALQFPQGSPKPWLMALAYGTTTPIGQAIGLAIHGLYDPASQTGLLMVGFMNAISSGLLLFAGLVELLAEDFLSDNSYKTLRGKRRYQACGSVVAGALLMALVGAWA